MCKLLCLLTAYLRCSKHLLYIHKIHTIFQPFYVQNIAPTFFKCKKDIYVREKWEYYRSVSYFGIMPMPRA